jgi:AraC-like DNA-binding protein
MSRTVLAASAPSLAFGVRFRPGGARSFLGVPLAALADQRVDLAELWPDAARLLDAAAAAGDATALVPLIERELARRARDAGPSPLVGEAVALLADDPGLRVERLAATLGVTRQHLARRFLDEVGQGPKLLARVFRFRRTLAALCARPQAELALAALDAGYSDQAHMNADFRQLGGATPLALLREQVPFLQDAAMGAAQNAAVGSRPPPLLDGRTSAAEDAR